MIVVLLLPLRPAIALAGPHPFTAALETWEAWSMADTMRQALQQARQVGDHKTLADFQRYPQWTQGPGPLEALAANRELVDLLTGWRWGAMRQAREQGRGWHEIGQALDVEADKARSAFLERLDRQRTVAARDPEVGRLIGYDPALARLGDDNQADRAELAQGQRERAELQRRALAYDDPGCLTDWPPDNGARHAGDER
jgi:hypothetical protein